MISPEQKLAEAKIMVMIQDLAGIIIGEDKSARHRVMINAFDWFFRAGSDFEAWCDFAGFNPDYIRLRAKVIHQGGLPFHRNKAGNAKDYIKKRRYRETKKLRLGSIGAQCDSSRISA